MYHLLEMSDCYCVLKQQRPSSGRLFADTLKEALMVTRSDRGIHLWTPSPNFQAKNDVL